MSKHKTVGDRMQAEWLEMQPDGFHSVRARICGFASTTPEISALGLKRFTIGGSLIFDDCDAPLFQGDGSEMMECEIVIMVKNRFKPIAKGMRMDQMIQQLGNIEAWEETK